MKWSTYTEETTKIHKIDCQILRFGIIELQNRVTQNDVTVRITNSKFFIGIIFRVINSISLNTKFLLDSLTQRLNFYFSTFELLTQS